MSLAIKREITDSDRQRRLPISERRRWSVQVSTKAVLFVVLSRTCRERLRLDRNGLRKRGAENDVYIAAQ